jgi:hypothetical protein
MTQKILEILARVLEFRTETCSGFGYHGSEKGEEYSFTIYKYNGESHYSLEDAKKAFVLHELKKEVEDIFEQLKTKTKTNKI